MDNAEKELSQPVVKNKETIELVVKNEKEDDYEFDIGMFWNQIKKRYILFLMVLLICLAIGAIIASGIFFKKTNTGSVSLIYNLNFNGIDEGKNPYGGAYQPKEIINSEVLADAIRVSQINEGREAPITVENFRQNLVIEGIVPNDIMQRISVIQEVSKKDATNLYELLDIEYFPTEYKLSLLIDKSWKLSSNEAKDFLNIIVDCYYKWFISTYGDYSFLATTLDDADFNLYDYDDQLDIYIKSLANLEIYLQAKIKMMPDFISPSKGLRFIDVLSQVNWVNDIDAERIGSLIMAFNLTKDRSSLEAILKTKQIRDELSLKAANDKIYAIKNSIESYEIPKSTVILPGFTATEPDTAGGTYETSAYEQYDRLIAMRIDQENAKIDKQRDLELLKLRIESLATDSSLVSESETLKYSEMVENDLIGLRKSINELTKLTNDISQEYYETYEFLNAVKLTIPAQFQGISLGVFYPALIVSAVLMFISYVAILLRVFFYVSSKSNEGK